jgi:cellobiose-specific phosphotransferase system component IIA
MYEESWLVNTCMVWLIASVQCIYVCTCGYIIICSYTFWSLCRLQQEIDDAEKEYSAKQKELSKAHEELNKRIFEHDKNIATGAVKADITLAVVHDAEDHLESQRLAAEAARNRLSQAKLQLRLQRKEFGNGLYTKLYYVHI